MCACLEAPLIRKLIADREWRAKSPCGSQHVGGQRQQSGIPPIRQKAEAEVWRMLRRMRRAGRALHLWA